MQIVAVTNPLQLGFARQAMIGVKVEGDLDPIVQALRAMVEVDYLVVTAGSFDILVEVVCVDDDHLLNLLNYGIRTDSGRPCHRVPRLPQARQTDLPVGNAVTKARATTPLNPRRVRNDTREHWL